MRLPDPTPLLQPHYRSFIAPTSRSAPVLRFGTLASRFWLLGLLPYHRSNWFLQFRAIACIRFTPSIRRPSPVQSSGIQRVLSQLIETHLVSTALELLTTRHRWVHFRSSPGCTPAQV